MRCFFSCFFFTGKPHNWAGDQAEGLQPCGPHHDLCQGQAGAAEGRDVLRPGPAPQPSHQLSSCSIRASWGVGEREVGVGGQSDAGGQGGPAQHGLDPSSLPAPRGLSGPAQPPTPLLGPYKVSKFSPRRTERAFQAHPLGPTLPL